MYSMKDLSREIDEMIRARQSAGDVLHPDWITQEVISSHPNIEGEDADFYSCCTKDSVRDAVRQRINRFGAKASVEADRQIVLEGFERLQTHYLIERDGTQVGVPVHQMTDEEMQAKEIEYEQMGAGCYQHAAEIRRFREARQAKKAA